MVDIGTETGVGYHPRQKVIGDTLSLSCGWSFACETHDATGGVDDSFISHGYICAIQIIYLQAREVD